ncbi:hypothetical protein GBA52_004103 [Prunus armeniaca]|nr:hypothetical protein GBA52_004103 [Prunus armeniaca]
MDMGSMSIDGYVFFVGRTAFGIREEDQNQQMKQRHSSTPPTSSTAAAATPPQKKKRNQPGTPSKYPTIN